MAAGSSLAVWERVERVSPELVLIDPALAERARSELADPVDTVARLQGLARESAAAAAARRLAEFELLSGEERSIFRSRARSRSHPRRGRPVLVIGFAAATLTTALVLGMSTDPGGAPTALEETTPPEAPTQVAPLRPPADAAPADAAPAPTPRPRPAKNRTPAVSRPVSRPFAWAPAPGASGYDVELYRGAERVFAAQTKKPAIDIPARWRFAGRSQRLSPGSYRWYVWPVVDGKRSAAATVQAKLSIAR